MDEVNTLLVRHLPSCLTSEEKEDLLKHFGATEVTVMGSRGKLRNCAFAAFNDSVAAGKALSRLHQLDVLGTCLVVEHARMTHIKLKTQEQARHGLNPNNKHDKDKPIPPVDGETASAHSTDFQLPADPLAPQHGLMYPRARNPHYVYPPPTIDTMVNISHCLACAPRFYEQVLHLMNKMNLPPPFGPATMLPPNLANREASSQLSPPASPKRKQDVASDESEMESEEESKPQLPPTPVIPNQRRKKQRITRQVFTGLPLDERGPQVKRRKPSSGAETVFDRPQETRKVDLRLLIGATLEIASSQDHDPVLVSEEDGNTGTFGTFAPPPRINEEQGDEEDDPLGGEPLTEEELRKNRLPDNELRLHSAFKKYSPGEPSSRLYVKNLSKKTTEKELLRVFGRYINPKSEEDMLRFDVRVMTEGRMKGQAFVGLPSETLATRALEETNGYKLHDRPICVQFARSAKAKQLESRK